MTFKHVGNVVFHIRHGQTVSFQHARLTTGDLARNIFHRDIARLRAGELWRRYTQQSIQQSLCSALNCPNVLRCYPCSRRDAGATVHVYHTNQPACIAYIPYVIFISTCSPCNHYRCAEQSGTNWGGTTPPTAYCYSRVMFVEISESAAQRKGKGQDGMSGQWTMQQ